LSSVGFFDDHYGYPATSATAATDKRKRKGRKENEEKKRGRITE
jgi:hypothetical protein